MNKIAKLENRKLELIRNIQLCQNSKRRVIGFVEELDRQYALKEIDLEIYKQKLNNVLKQRTLEQWTNYYNGCITYYRHGLELCDKELRRQENKTKALQLTTIAGVLAVFILSFMFVNPEFTGFSIYQPGNIINESVHFKIDQFVPNSSILEINFNEEKYFSNISKYLAELTSIDKDNNTIYGYNVSELNINIGEFNISVPDKKGEHVLISRIIDNGSLIAENITQISIEKETKVSVVNVSQETGLANKTQENIEINITETFDNTTIPPAPVFTRKDETKDTDEIISERNIGISKDKIKEINILGYSAEEISFVGKEKKTLIIHKPIIFGSLFNEAVPLESKDEFTYTSTFEDTTVEIEFDSQEIKQNKTDRKFSKYKIGSLHSYKIGYKFLLPTQTFKSRYRISSSSPIKIIDDFIGHIKTGKFELDFRTEIEKGYSIEIKQVHSNIIYIYLNKDYSIEGKNVNDIVEIDPTLTISSATTEICGEITAYDTVIIDNAGIATICARNVTASTGYANFSLGANGNFTVYQNGTIVGAGKGGRGGSGCSGNSCTATQGDNSTGTAGGAARTPNGAGGGGGTRAANSYGTGGGGGGFGGGGGAGGNNSGVAGLKGLSGLTEGTAGDLALLMGSGGGGSAGDPTPADGGSGGGGLKINASSGYVSIFGVVGVNGSAGGAGDSSDNSGGGGGGGGHIILIARNLTLNKTAVITADGAAGGDGGSGTSSDSCGGGGGGGGRVVYVYQYLALPVAGVINTTYAGRAGTAADTDCDASTDIGNSTAGTTGTLNHSVFVFPNVTAPNISIARINATSNVPINTAVKINASVTDDEGDLSIVELEVITPSAVSYNVTPTKNGNEYHNSTTILSATGTWQFRFHANDTSNNRPTPVFAEDGAGTLNITVDSGADTAFPQWDNATINETAVYNNTYITFNTSWTDNQGLSSYIFEINQSGTPVNSTAALFSGQANTSINTSLILARPGIVVYWRFYANDTSNNTNQTTLQSFTVGDRKPNIDNITAISQQSIVESGVRNVTFYALVSDADGVGDISIVNATFLLTGEQTRYNSSCSLVSNVNITQANYSCTVPIWWFDSAGTWTVNVTANDTVNNASVPGNTTFSLTQTTAFSIGPSALAWATLNVTSINATSNSLMLLNNTGNKNITSNSIQVTVINLIGETNASQYLNASNFTVDLDTGGLGPSECGVNATSGATMINDTAVNITGSLMPRGNFTRNFGNETSSQEQLYYCLTAVSTTAVNPQSYSTNLGGTWTVTAA